MSAPQSSKIRPSDSDGRSSSQLRRPARRVQLERPRLETGPACAMDFLVPNRYRRSSSRYPARSQSPPPWSRYRSSRSPSPPPRREMASRRSRSRSRSPRANYTIETPEQRRRRLLTEKVMSIETYHRLLQDPHSSWSKANKTKGTKMPIPVPLERNENVGDYQQKFEFWLAQRNVTLASLREDVCRERSCRCGYANWRVQTGFGQTVA